MASNVQNKVDKAQVDGMTDQPWHAGTEVPGTSID
jgi:hypothetical protein